MTYTYTVTRGIQELHESCMAEFAVAAFQSAISASLRDGWTMPKLTIMEGKYILYEYYPRQDGNCEIVKSSAPPNRVYRSIEYAIEHIKDLVI